MHEIGVFEDNEASPILKAWPAQPFFVMQSPAGSEEKLQCQPELVSNNASNYSLNRI